MASHCGTCGVCVNGFDHHCQAVNNCIGSRNIRCFVLLLIVSFAAGLFTSVNCGLSLFLTPLNADDVDQLAPWLTSDRLFILISITTFVMMNFLMS